MNVKILIKTKSKEEIILEVVFLIGLFILIISNFYLLTTVMRTNAAKINGYPIITSVDGYRWYWLAEHVYKNGQPPLIDHYRANPSGLPYPRILPFIDYETAYWPLILLPIFKTVWLSCIYAPPVFACIISLLLYFFVRRATKNKLMALAAAVLFVLTPISTQRLSAGFFDHDVFTLLYIVVLLWLTFEILNENRLNRKVLLLLPIFILFYGMFIATSKLWMVYHIILCLTILILPLFNERIDLKILLIFVVIYFISGLINARYTFYGLNFSLEKYLKYYVLSWRTLLMGIVIVIHTLAFSIKNNSKKLFKRSITDFEFKACYFGLLLILTIITIYSLLNIKPIRNIFIVVKPVGIARTIAEWRPLLNWELVEKGEVLNAVIDLINKLPVYYNSILFYTSFAIFIFSLIFIPIYVVFLEKKVPRNMAIFYCLTVSYFLLSILVGVQAIRAMSQFIVAISLMFSFVFVLFDEKPILKFLKEENLTLNEIFLIITSIVLIPVFIGVYVFLYYDYLKSLSSVSWIAALTPDWWTALHWAKNNTPNGSVFNSWWDYGDWIYVIANRPVTIDAGHAYDKKTTKEFYFKLKKEGYQINEKKIITYDYLNAYFGFTKPPKDSWKFMRFFNVSYFIISGEELGKWGAISYNAQYAARTYLGLPTENLASVLVPCKQQLIKKESNNITSVIFLCSQNLRAVLQLDENNTPIGLYLTGTEPYSQKIPLSALVVSKYFKNSGVYWFDNKTYGYGFGVLTLTYDRATGGEYYGLILVLPAEQPTINVSQLVNSTFVRLYLMGEDTPEFKCVYRCNEIPFVVSYQTLRGTYITYYGPVKIWKLNTSMKN